jgi:PAS domain S-box-containing protein
VCSSLLLAFWAAWFVLRERQAAEKQLRRSHERYRKLLQVDPSAMALCDGSLKVLEWNAAAERLYGFSRGEVMGVGLPTVPPAKQSELEEFLRRVRRGDAVFDFETVRRKGLSHPSPLWMDHRRHTREGLAREHVPTWPHAQSAMKKKEILCVNFSNRDTDSITAAELDERQVGSMRLNGPVVVSHRATVQRSDAVTRLRIAEVQRYKCLEVTGFLEFDDVIFFAVLLTPRETQRSNIRRLESVLRQAEPIKLKRDNTALIMKIQEQLKEAPPASARARLLRDLGHWYRDMGQFNDARQPLEESLSLDPDSGYHISNDAGYVKCFGLVFWYRRQTNALT